MQNGFSTNGDVTVSVPESGLTVQLYKDGELVGNYEGGTPITEEGGYRITVSDAAGNITEVAFTIDKSVDFAADIYDNAIVNSMTFTAGENLTVSGAKDGEIVAYKFGDTLTVAGSYTATLTDELGNSTEYIYIFEILYSVNGGAVALIVIAVLVVVGIIITVVIMRKEGKFGKIKARKIGRDYKIPKANIIAYVLQGEVA